MKQLSRKSVLTTIKEWVLITLGILIYTAGWSIFLTPNNLVGGGVSGISAIIQYATGIKMGFTYLVINAIILASICLNLFQTYLPQEIIQNLAFSNGKLLCSLIGGAMAGFGIGMSISQGGSSGGTDIVALIYTKYHNVSPGKVILLMDVFIIASSLLVPSFDANGQALPFVEKFTTVVYGMIIVTVCGNVCDIYLAGSVLDGEGWYTKQNLSVLMVLTRKTDVNMLMRSIKRIDPDSFLTVSSVTGVYGRGFDTLKLDKKS